MTEGYQPYPSSDAETEYLPPVSADADTTLAIGGSSPGTASGDHSGGGGQSGSSQGTTEVAKEQAADLKQGTVQAGQHVASVAKDQAVNVTAEAGRQAKDLLGQARSELGQQASAQQQRVADGLRSLSQQLHSMSQHSDQPGVAADLARQGAQTTDQVASWFEDRDPAGLVDEVRSFARRRPGAFLLMAAGAGLLAGRLTRGLKDDASSGSDEPAAGDYGRSDLTTGGAGLYGYPDATELTTGTPGLVGGAGLTGSTDPYQATGPYEPTGGYEAQPPITGGAQAGYPTGNQR